MTNVLSGMLNVLLNPAMSYLRSVKLFFVYAYHVCVFLDSLIVKFWR